MATLAELHDALVDLAGRAEPDSPDPALVYRRAVEASDERPGSTIRWRLAVLATAAAVILVLLLVSLVDRSDNTTVIIDQPNPPASTTTTLPSSGDDDSGVPADSTVTTFELSLEGTVVDSESLTTEVLATEVLASTIGDLRWTVLSASEELLGAAGIVASPVGLVTVTSDGQLLVSDDAVEWRVIASPFPGELLELAVGPGDRRYFLNTTEGQWESKDFVTWTNGDLNAASLRPGLTDWITGPEVLQIELSPSRDDVEMPGGATLTSVSVGVDLETLVLQAGGDALQQRVADGEVLTYGGCCESWDPATGILDVKIWESATARDAALRGRPEAPDPQSAGVQLRLSASGTGDDWVIDIEDVADGEIIESIAGSAPILVPEDPTQTVSGRTLDDTLELLATGGRLRVYFLSSGDSVELVDNPPWEGLPGGWPNFVTADGQVYAYYPSGAWQSADGRTWQSRDSQNLPTIHVGDPPTSFFEGPGGVLLAAADLTLAELDVESPESAPPVFLRSDDGVNWAASSQPPTFTIDDIGFSHLAATEFGFLFLVFDRSEEVVQWASLDGDIWERAEGAPPFDSFPTSDSDPEVQPVISSSQGLVTITAQGSQPLERAWVLEIIAPR